jgi:hypothetical protein
MSKYKMIATDTIYVGEELKHAGDEFEVAGEGYVKQLEKRGHILADTPEAEAFLSKKGSRRSLASKKTEKTKPAKHTFNSDPVDDGKIDLSKMVLEELQELAGVHKVKTVDGNKKPLPKKKLIEALEEKLEGADLA